MANSFTGYENLGTSREAEKPNDSFLPIGRGVSEGVEKCKGTHRMAQQPTLETKRLILRPFKISDGWDVQRLAGDRDIASTTLNMPHPYEDGIAEKWIGGHREKFEKGLEATFAVVLREGNQLIGSISLMNLNQPHAKAEMGYWIGKPYWNHGFCTEAAKALLVYGFNSLKLNRIYALHFTRNPASGRVMQKIGMHHEGTLRQDIKKKDQFEDLEVYGILRSEI
jgi:RimJ/RimL family protein N-acetyltransferase